MTAKNILRDVVEMSHFVTMGYVADLSDSDLLLRSVPGANHIAWQLGHLISSTAQMLTELGCTFPSIPEGFAAAHSKETAGLDDPRQFKTKAEYQALAEQMKQATLAAIEATPESKLDEPGPEAMRDYAPTIGAVLAITGTHWLMHAGQFVPVRRKLGKPPMFGGGTPLAFADFIEPILNAKTVTFKSTAVGEGQQPITDNVMAMAPNRMRVRARDSK